MWLISWLEKVEQIVDICCNVRLAYISMHTVYDNGDRIKESATPETKCLFV
jgi:hypothetical protein